MEYENLSFAIQYDAFVFSFSLGALWDNGGFFFNAFLGFGQKAVDGHGSSHFWLLKRSGTYNHFASKLAVLR